MFVTAISGDLSDWGVGKLLGQDGAQCSVEYFDAPMREPIVRTCLASDLRSLKLPEQSRVYVFNTAIGAWEIGRILDDHGSTQLVKFPNGRDRHLAVSEVFFRWNRPIEDPTSFLAAHISETPRFTEGRAPFVRSLLRQRSAALGMSALLSSAIELEAHQIEVVRKVLQDPIQRYLLADEVGLGKTIEAGVLIRQCILDDHDSACVLILVPDALTAQWRRELSSKFFLGDLLDETVFVEPFSAAQRIKSLLPRATMLVIDEAHHLTTAAPSKAALYDDLVATAPNIERILLLSATPALHNERGFLRMLHLLDPRGYPLDSEEAFKKRVADRQALAEIVAALTPDNAFYLDSALDQLAEMFPDDIRLQEEAARLRDLLFALPEESDPQLVAAIASVRDHLSEVYRLHRRVLRHRRRNVEGLTPNRSGADIAAYRSAAARIGSEAADEWRFLEMTAQDASNPSQASLDACAELMERRSVYAVAWEQRRGLTATEPIHASAFHTALQAMADAGRARDRIEALAAALKARMGSKTQFVVFCSDPSTADEVATRLSTHFDGPIDRHDPHGETWSAFNHDASRRILVCDQRAEEGLNLQGGEKIVVHYDLPWNPNRIEQRLGRVDRYGSGEPVKSLLLLCEDDPVETAWTRYLNEALRVFDRSIASLQYLIENTARELPALLLSEGFEGILDLLERDQGDTGLIEQEIKSINQQDALDALGAPPSETLDALSDVDAEWREIETDLDAWLQNTLLFGRKTLPGDPPNAPGPTLRYSYQTGAHHTLVPLEIFHEKCKPAIDRQTRAHRSRDIWTVPYSYRRATALSRQGRAHQARLLRYGDPLLSGLTDITERDERGRSTAVWRHLPQLRPGQALLYFRFDFVVEAEIASARDVLDLSGQLSGSGLSSLKRRGDMALAPSFHTLWLDAELRPVTNPALLSGLEMPYRPNASDQGSRDFNLNPKRWRLLKASGLPQLDHWSDLCLAARDAAEVQLRSLPAFNASLDDAARRAEAADAGRLGLLQARAVRSNANANDERDLHLERALSEQLIIGVRTPRVTLDAASACFLGSDVAVAGALARA